MEIGNLNILQSLRLDYNLRGMTFDELHISFRVDGINDLREERSCWRSRVAFHGM
jgi:hypothetical protein